MKLTRNQWIIVAVVVAAALLYMYKSGKLEFFSGAFDPSTRAGIDDIGPEEGFCAACL